MDPTSETGGHQIVIGQGVGHPTSETGGYQIVREQGVGYSTSEIEDTR